MTAALPSRWLVRANHYEWITDYLVARRMTGAVRVLMALVALSLSACLYALLGSVDGPRGDVPVALRELQAAVDAGAPNPAEALTSLAEATLKAGQRDVAKKHLIKALETTPRHERAQELLLQIVEKSDDDGGVQ